MNFGTFQQNNYGIQVQRYWVENVNANREDCCNLKSYKL